MRTSCEPSCAGSATPPTWKRASCNSSGAGRRNNRRGRRPGDAVATPPRAPSPARGQAVNVIAGIDKTSSDVIAALGFTDEMRILRQRIAAWVESLRPRDARGAGMAIPLGIEIFSTPDHLRLPPVPDPGPIPEQIMSSAVVVEFFHNVSLVIDDIVDRSPERRGRATLHTRFGELNALMVSGYIVAEGYRYLGADLEAIGLFSELLKRLGVAECMQWRLRRQMLGVEDWRRIAGEDTGSMFEVCACLGDRSTRLRKFGGLLGLLYHGCDDVGDVRGAIALGGGGEEDVRDGILTLPGRARDPRSHGRRAVLQAGPRAGGSSDDRRGLRLAIGRRRNLSRFDRRRSPGRGGGFLDRFGAPSGPGRSDAQTEPSLTGRDSIQPVGAYLRQLCSSLKPSTSRAFRLERGASNLPISRVTGVFGACLARNSIVG